MKLVPSVQAGFEFALGFKPVGEIAPMPADRMAAKSLLFREAPENGQCEQYPTVTSREARDIMGAEDLIKRRKRLVDPPGKKDSRRAGGWRDKSPRHGFGRAHGFSCSCAVPVVQGRVVTH